MSLKLIKRVKGFRVDTRVDSRVYTRVSLSRSIGFIGKAVPFSPTFLGIFILKQYFSKKFSNQLEKDLPSFLGKLDFPSVVDLPSFLKGGID